MLRTVISVLLLAAVSGAAVAAPDSKDSAAKTAPGAEGGATTAGTGTKGGAAAVTPDPIKAARNEICTTVNSGSISPEKFATYKAAVGELPDLRIESHLRYLPMGRAAALEVDQVEGVNASPKIVYRILVSDESGERNPPPPVLLSGVDVRSEEIPLVPAKPGPKKTRLVFTPSLGDPTWPWPQTQLLVIACPEKVSPAVQGVVMDVVPNGKGVLQLPRSSKDWSRGIAILCCLLCYLFAVTGTYRVHQRQRIVVDGSEKTGIKPKTDAKPDTGIVPEKGTNYASWWQHLNPVVLTAGGSGMGSATKLQIFFFSLVIFGVVLYIWLLSGHLTEMSSTVLLLMGISGIGATASAGAELTKNRLDFENWSWLINRGWLPKGGIAEVNMAKWKDIVTTGGEFDATRFQMVTFTLLVGGALLMAGSDLMDLSSFEIPQALLGILGLSQVVFVAGKLTAPPAVSDLNNQILKLRKAEADLNLSLSKVNTGSFNPTTIPMIDDPGVQAASAALLSYENEWETSSTMFEATLGRLIPHEALAKHPPFEVPDVVRPTPNKLPAGERGTPYAQTLAASGGVAPYTWTLVKGKLPEKIEISPQGMFSGAPEASGTTTFVLKVIDAKGASNSREFVIEVP